MNTLRTIYRVGCRGYNYPGRADSSLSFNSGEVTMETLVRVAETPVISTSTENDLDSYLDTVAAATALFKSAVDTYLLHGPEGACWQQAKRMADLMRTLDDMQQRLETGTGAQSRLGGLVSELIDPMSGVSRLLKDMKRQITGFAIESGFSVPGRRVPSHLIPDVQELTDEVCAAVDALVESYRPSLLWLEQTSIPDRENGVSWYEGQADRLSMQLLKKIFADEGLDIESKLPMAQLIEEIDRVADQAESLDLELRASCMNCLPLFAIGHSH